MNSDRREYYSPRGSGGETRVLSLLLARIGLDLRIAALLAATEHVLGRNSKGHCDYLSTQVSYLAFNISSYIYEKDSPKMKKGKNRKGK